MSSLTPSATESAAAASSSVSASLSVGSNLKVVGIILAIISGILIGSSFVFKKKGLVRAAAKAGTDLGEGVAYLKSVLWWSGMIMMIFGEICNFAAYAFVEAIVVTPLGALSVVVCAILSKFFLKEELTFFGWLGCGLCIIGSVVIALNGPKEESVGQIREFQKLFLSPGFIAYISVLIAASLVIVFYFAPRYGKRSMLWYIFVCSMIGGISVSVTTGLGAAIVTSAKGDNQFKYWFMYFLLAFVAVTLIIEVYYLNVALALFNTAMVTPTYYVIFTFFSMVTTVVLFQGLKASPTQIITIVMGFLTICVGITILQMSKVDPVQLSKLDRRSTILLQAARSKTETMEEKGALGVEDPGIDALRGSFGTVGSIIRARSARRMSQSSRTTSYRTRPPGAAAPYQPTYNLGEQTNQEVNFFEGLKRHQLYDAPVPRKSPSAESAHLPPHRQTIKFGDQDLVHQYHPPGTGDNTATHEQRSASRRYPPTRTDSDMQGASNILEDDATIRGQTLLVPSTIESSAQSAPARSDSGFSKDSTVNTSTIYSHMPSTSSQFSFPSVTDSARSSNTPTNSFLLAEDNTRERQRAPSPKRTYPKGSAEDDREESVGLWSRQSSDEESAGGGDPLSPSSLSSLNGGIRLVPQSHGRF